MEDLTNLVGEIIDQIDIHSIRSRYHPDKKITWAAIKCILSQKSIEDIVDFFCMDYPSSRVEYVGNRTVFIFSNTYDRDMLDAASAIIFTKYM